LRFVPDDRALQPFPTAGPCHLESKWRRFKPDPKFKVKVKSQSGFDLVLGFNRTIFRPSVGVVLSGTTPESDRRERIANDPECWVKNGVYRFSGD
jgi:hypothetical protein